jgi:peptidoglycan/LPS O-acetylase OafA/YrhL
VPALDGFRALAAVSVVAFHLINTTAPVWFDEGPPELVRNALHHLGVNAVSAFFVLSGFLVARPLAADPARLVGRPAGRPDHLEPRRAA